VQNDSILLVYPSEVYLHAEYLTYRATPTGSFTVVHLHPYVWYRVTNDQLTPTLTMTAHPPFCREGNTTLSKSICTLAFWKCTHSIASLLDVDVECVYWSAAAIMQDSIAPSECARVIVIYT